MKQRFSYLDLRLVTNEVESDLTNCYLQNIYSLENSNRHFLFKFDAGVKETGKRFLIVDPGMRYHLTKYQHQPTNQPSHFVQKLRKFLKNRRATDFWVAPASRLMVITFTEGQFYLVFEFFAGGNIILLNSDMKVITLFRVVRDVGPNHQNYQVGESYNLQKDQMLEKEFYQSAPNAEELKEWTSRDKLGKALYSRVSDTSSSLLEYYLRKNNLDPKQKLASESDLEAVGSAVSKSLEHAHRLMKMKSAVPGFILYDKDGNSLEFEPFPDYFNLVHPDNRVEQFQTYNETVDQYFGAILSEKGVNKVDQLHALADTRLEAARDERRKRVDQLFSHLTKNEQLGQAIQENAELVESAISAVKALVDQGADWGDADNLIKHEKQKGNFVAEAIDSLQLDQRRFTMSLNDLKVSVHIDRSAHANARDYFEMRKSALTKIEKTELHANKALKSAEIKIKRDLEANLKKHKQASTAAQLHAIRATHWFEKFWWFLTSTSHLVIAARDDTQRDLLLRRYFNEGDLALTSDASEASLLIIKHKPQAEITPQALMQATAFCVGTSVKSWEAKSKAPGWFLTRKQVPKVNENGDPISFRDFQMITPRTLVPAPQLDMGIALLWQCEQSSNEVEDENPKETPDDSDGENAFPDTQFDSDDDFPDTNVDTDVSEGDSESDENESGVEEGSPSNRSFSSPSENDLQSDDRSGSVSHVRTPNETAHTLSNHPSDTEESEALSPTASPPSLDSHSEQTASLSRLPKKVRGNKKKLQKYLHQDEEDRKAAMERLGTLKGVAKREAEQREREKAKVEQQALVQQRKDRRRKTELAYINDTETAPENQPFPSDLRYKFTEDEPIVATIPMFAPWASIQKAQYKVKLVFGSMKKGKATTEVLKIILKTGDTPAGEREEKLIAAVKPVDVQQSIAVSRVQIATATNTKGSKPGDNRGSKGKTFNKKKR